MNLSDKVKVIPAVKPKMTFDSDEWLVKRKKVAAYARVSTGRDEQQTSFKSQMEYYTRVIMSNPDWEFVGIYADEGISGRSMKKRKRFREMVADALDGKIDLILVKSVSRFARNVLDGLTIIEQLREKGVPVIFEKENLNSMNDDKRTNFMLTMYSSIAQEESDSLSDSVNWGLQRRNEQGKVRKAPTYGYDVLNHEYVINESQAGIVRLMFELYLEGNSYFNICKELERRGVKSPTGLDRWDTTTVAGMLCNEKYVGDALLQKTIKKPWVQKKRPASADTQMYLVEDDHPAIISDEIFERAQRELQFRKSIRAHTKSGKGGYSSKYVFSSKIYCYNCGSIFRRHFYLAGQGRKVYTWTCANHKNNGNRACTQQAIKETEIIKSFMRVQNMLITDKANMIKNIRDSIDNSLGKFYTGEEKNDIKKSIEKKQRELVVLVRAATSADAIRANNHEKDKLIQEIETLQDKLKAIENRATEMMHTNERLKIICDLIDKKAALDTFDEMVFRRMVKRITVDGKELTYDFGNSILITDSVD